MNRNKKISQVHINRRLRFGTASTLLTVLVVAAVIILNVILRAIADDYPITWDLSKEKSFTLSTESVNIAKGVKNNVEIIVFMDEKDFSNPTLGATYKCPELNTALKEFHTALQQYKSYSNGKVTYQFINPDIEPTKFAAYNDYEVNPGEILFIAGEKGDRYRTCSFYDLFIMTYIDYYRSQYIFESLVEKTLASKILSLQSDRDRIVQVLLGHDEDLEVISGLKTLYELNGYIFEELNINNSVEFNPKAEIALIAAPSVDYTNDEIQKIQDWMSNNELLGHHLMVFTSVTADCPNLYAMLEDNYKIKVSDQLIRETDLDRVLNNDWYSMVGDVVKTPYTEISHGSKMVSTPFARRLTTTLPTTASQEGAGAYELGLPLVQHPDSAQLIKLEDHKTNDASTAFNAAVSEYPLSSTILYAKHWYDNNTGKNTYGTVLVSGCPAMVYNEQLRNAVYDNEGFMLDVANSITNYSTDLAVSNKIISTNTIDFSTGVQIALGLGVFTVGIPVVLLIVCLIVFLRRKFL